MFHINIDVPRPGLTLLLIAAVIGMGIAAAPGGQASLTVKQGIATAPPAETPPDPRQVMARQEGILRTQLEQLRAEGEATGDPRIETAIAEATERLRMFLTDKRAAEQALLKSVEEQVFAQTQAVSASRQFYYGRTKPPSSGGRFALWPVEPRKGISAIFHDSAYAERFGVRHDGVDIPTPQGTELHAVDDGVIISAIDNGYGFSSITLQTDAGVSVLYGHVSSLLVQEGDRISAGDVIGLSGGRPGTKGAGLLTTGAHLHIEVIVDGHHKDPLEYLPPRDQVTGDQSSAGGDQGRVFWRNGERIY